MLISLKHFFIFYLINWEQKGNFNTCRYNSTKFRLKASFELNNFQILKVATKFNDCYNFQALS